ncbi:MAG: hypothetical protein ABIR29_07200, partial [Chthoniobacterales bacterium]
RIHNVLRVGLDLFDEWFHQMPSEGDATYAELALGAVDTFRDSKSSRAASPSSSKALGARTVLGQHEYAFQHAIKHEAAYGSILLRGGKNFVSSSRKRLSNFSPGARKS